jgi:fatty acid synthase
VSSGKILFPGTGLLFIVWETFAMMQGMPYEQLPVTFEEVKFLRATSLMKNQDVILSISIHRS